MTTLAQRVQALEDWMLVAQNQPEDDLGSPEYAEQTRKLNAIIETGRRIYASKMLDLIEKELQKPQISTLRVKNLAQAFQALRGD